MKRSSKPLRRTPIRKVSKTRVRKNYLYNKAKAAWFPDHPFCEIGPVLHKAGYDVKCKKVTTHVHHVRGRTGAMLFNTAHWLASCSGECHPQFIHNFPSTARRLGLLK